MTKIRTIVTFEENYKKQELLKMADFYFYRLLGTVNESNYEIVAQQREEAIQLRNRYEEDLLPKAMLVTLEQPILNQQKQNQQKQCIGVAICIQDLKKEQMSSLDMMEQLYLHMWQTSILNAARDYIKETINYIQSPLETNHNTNHNTNQNSSWYAPGIGQIPIDLIEDLYDKINPTSIGMERKGTTLYPEKSFIGYIMVNNDTQSPCQQCNRLANCDYCMYQHKRMIRSDI